MWRKEFNHLSVDNITNNWDTSVVCVSPEVRKFVSGCPPPNGFLKFNVARVAEGNLVLQVLAGFCAIARGAF